MLYYSEELKKSFKTAEECLDAEKKAVAAREAAEKEKQLLAETRKTRAKEVDDAYNALLAAEKKYKELVKSFVNDFGSYHKSYVKVDFDTIDELFDSILRFF